VGTGERATSSGGAIMQLLRQAGYGGRFVPVNPKDGTIFGYESVTSIAAIDPPVDLAVIVIRPAATMERAGVPMFNDVEKMAEAAGLLARYPALRDSARSDSFSSVTIGTRHHP